MTETKRQSAPQSAAPLVADLVCAMLSVNHWPLERSLDIRPGLREEGLLTLSHLNNMSDEELFLALKRAGYMKSDFVVGLLADRLAHMAQVLSAGGLEALQSALRSGDTREADALLLSIKGVGPQVLAIFKALQQSA